MTHCEALDRRCPSRGAGALAAVLLLSIVMAITLAFLNRSVVFEQKSSANQYRATLAFEAAEAGLEWATAMLNKPGRVSAACTDSAIDTDTRFRDRYLATSGAAWRTASPSGAVVAACVSNQGGNGWQCSCPAAGTAPTPTALATGGHKPSFAIAVVANPAARAVDLVSYGCTAPIVAATCDGDGAASVRVTLAHVPALATSPGAPLSARGSVNVGNAALGVHNTDPASAGVTVRAGAGIDAGSLRITTTAGTPPLTTLVGNDDALRTATADQMFLTFFGVPKVTWKQSIADRILVCPCTQAEVQAALASGARKLWLQGNVAINDSVPLGSATDPFVIVADGAIALRGSPSLYGVLYGTAISWDDTAGGGALLVGAVLSETDYGGNGTPDLAYDPRVIDRLATMPGAFVRVPGSWRDY